MLAFLAWPLKERANSQSSRGEDFGITSLGMAKFFFEPHRVLNSPLGFNLDLTWCAAISASVHDSFRTLDASRLAKT